MIKKILIYVRMFFEDLKSAGWKNTIKEIFSWRRPAVPVYIDCQTKDFSRYSLEKTGCSISLINRDMINQYSESCKKSRIMKASYYLKKGYRALVLIKQDKIIGDLWFIVHWGNRDKKYTYHPDLKMLGINIKSGEAYAFDMYVAESERGKDLSTRFMASAINCLKEMGISRVYGHYMKKNIPALWIHKLIGFKELPEVYISRLLFLRLSHNK